MESKLISVTVFDKVKCYYPWFILKVTDGTTVKDLCKGIFTREYDGLADFQEIPESRNPVHNDKLDARVCVLESLKKQLTLTIYLKELI